MVSHAHGRSRHEIGTESHKTSASELKTIPLYGNIVSAVGLKSLSVDSHVESQFINDMLYDKILWGIELLGMKP